MQEPCPVCTSLETQLYYQQTNFHKGRERVFLQCGQCSLIFVPRAYHLSDAQEKAIYDMHENNPDDPGYREFLGRLATPLLERLPVPSYGLDFGSGPGPTLSVILEEAGHKVALYDKFYAPDPAPLSRDYQFITATEVVEHLAAPGELLDMLWDRLVPNGLLGIMTKRLTDSQKFSHWHYKNDPTHITFFSEKTFRWIARKWQAECEFFGNDVVVVSKNTGKREKGKETRMVQRLRGGLRHSRTFTSGKWKRLAERPLRFSHLIFFSLFPFSCL